MLRSVPKAKNPIIETDFFQVDFPHPKDHRMQWRNEPRRVRMSIPDNYVDSDFVLAMSDLSRDDFNYRYSYTPEQFMRGEMMPEVIEVYPPEPAAIVPTRADLQYTHFLARQGCKFLPYKTPVHPHDAILLNQGHVMYVYRPAVHHLCVHSYDEQCVKEYYFPAIGVYFDNRRIMVMALDIKDGKVHRYGSLSGMQTICFGEVIDYGSVSMMRAFTPSAWAIFLQSTMYNLPDHIEMHEAAGTRYEKDSDIFIISE